MVMLALLSLVQSRQWETPSLFCTIKDKRITESSGIAPSARYPGSYYTHNDSGDTARIFRFDSTGVTAEFSLKGVKAKDWEDIATASYGGKNWLYVGDIGDNKSKRPEIFLYRFEEPGGSVGVISKFDTYTLTYPDGPHNCEALVVDPKSGDIYLVTKDETVSEVFRLPSPKSSKGYMLSKLGEIKPNTGMGKYGHLVTAGSAASNGKHVIIRTYSGALEYSVTESFKDWWRSKPQIVRMPLDPQGEGICYSLDGRSLLTTTEGETCPVHRISIKK